MKRNPKVVREYRNENTIEAGMDVDHVIDLQLGGKDDASNLAPLDASVNRSLGAQIAAKIREYPVGTVFGKFIIDE